MNIHPSRMILLTVVMIVLPKGIISSDSLNPPSYKTYLQPQNPKIFMLLDQWSPDFESEMFRSSNDPGSRLVRNKRIGSLSIVNSLDVLRQRVLLELARKKALQDQRQIDANRRFLESVGKRSVRPYSESAKDMSGSINSGIEYAIEQGWLPDPLFRDRNEQSRNY